MNPGNAAGSSSLNWYGSHSGLLVDLQEDGSIRPQHWYIQRLVENEEIKKEKLMLSDHETLAYVFNMLNNQMTNGTQRLKKLHVWMVDVTDEVSVTYPSFLEMVCKRDRSKSFALGFQDLIRARHIKAGDEISLSCDASSATFALKLLNPSA